MRLIDVDALKESFGEQRLDGDWCICGDETTARDLIDEAPIIDAEPVRHGKWIQIWENPNDSNNVLCSCSVCGKNNNWYKNILHPYCPECGAKMDLND